MTWATAQDLKACPYLDPIPFAGCSVFFRAPTSFFDVLTRRQGMEDARGIMVAAIKSAGKDDGRCQPIGGFVNHFLDKHLGGFVKTQLLFSKLELARFNKMVSTIDTFNDI